MITHDQLIYTIRAIYPQISASDHGSAYWVGMEVDGDVQVRTAWILQWNFKDLARPTAKALAAKWLEVKDGYFRQKKADSARAKRNELLLDADVQVQKAMDAGDKALIERFGAYRQRLRDLPVQSDFPENITWPEPPAA